MGSARILSREAAEALVRKGDTEKARTALKMSAYYEAAREFAFRLTNWSKALDHEERRFVVCTGGGPGIMEAANRGAAEAKGLNVGLTISIPVEEFDNPYVTRELAFHFHYFFMRKFWFAYLAKAVIVFPGGYGTLDELFELLTLVQTRKMRKPMPIVLFGTEYWREIVNFDALARHGMIDPKDIAGIVVTPRRLVGIYSDPSLQVVRYPDGNVWHYISICFECTVRGGELTLCDETLALDWFSPRRLPRPLLPHHRIRIRDARARRPGAFVR